MGNCCKPIKEYDNYDNYDNINNTNNNNEIWSFHEECCICMENPIQAALLKCGHLKFCIKCAKELTYNDNPNLHYCTLCRGVQPHVTCKNCRMYLSIKTNMSRHRKSYRCLGFKQKKRD